MMSKKPEFTYKQLVTASKMAEAYGAKIMGLGAFTSVVGDAGVTVAQKAPIAITTGNSLTVVAAVETCRAALQGMQTELKKVMVVGATGSIGAACVRWFASEGYAVVMIAPKIEKLKKLKSVIEQEIAGAQLEIALKADVYAPECQAIITTTSAFGQRVLDVSTLAPGTVVCDIARPSDISAVEAALRPDVCVLESGEVYIPPDRQVDFGYNIGLPKGVAYACLGETALLAMEGKFESFTLGRDLDLTKVREIKRLYDKHEFSLSQLRTPGGIVVDEAAFEVKRVFTKQLRADHAKFKVLKQAVAEALQLIEPSSKGVRTRKSALSVLKKRIAAQLLKKNDTREYIPKFKISEASNAGSSGFTCMM
jgi:predicted amino acid dehydrogenase